MEFKFVFKENWLSQKITNNALVVTLFMVFMLVLGSSFYLNNLFDAHSWMPATRNLVFQQHQYYRLWTTLFAHGDYIHLLSNLVLFFPFSYYLTGNFSWFFFPLLGFFMGGIANLIVLLTMKPEVQLIGASGVVHWMGAAWMILAFLINRHQRLSHRWLKLLGISAILFIPDTYKPEVSYLAHLNGYLLGLLSGWLTYHFYKKKFLAAEKYSIELDYVGFDYSEKDDSALLNNHHDD